MIFTLQFLGALFLDLLFGDPRFIPHPVQGIGWFCTQFENITRRLFSCPNVAGVMAFLLVFCCTLVIPAVLLLTLHHLSPVAEAIMAVVLLYTSIACRDLYTHSIQVYNALQNPEDIDKARQEVGKIVGRDTTALDRQGVCRACVETVAENLVDGITAPIFYAILVTFLPTTDLFAPVSVAVLGAYAYKAINTMDSMYGYKNEQYLHFGTFAARVDDIATLLPARISGLLLIAAAWLLRFDANGAMRIFFRDRLQHASPNGGHPEAAVAGSLGVQLGGTSSYFGTIVSKPTLGDAHRQLEARDIISTNHLMFVTTGLFCTILLVVRMLVTGD